MWPRKAEYQQAIHNPYGCFEESELQSCNPELDSSGLPRAIGGGTAVIFPVRCETRKLAVRCFLTQTTDRQARFTTICRELSNGGQQENLGIVPFDYIQKGIRVKALWYPILKMEWVEGDSLLDYIRKHGQESGIMRQLAEKWLLLSKAWRQRKLAHGNLQASNIMVCKDSLKLLDYDGVYCPAFSGWAAEELGSPHYQHPGRNLSHFGEYLDNFSDWIIYTSLVAISVDARFLKFVDHETSCLLFRREDFVNPSGSEVLFRLREHQNEELRALGGNMERLLTTHIQQVPALEPEKVFIVKVPSAAEQVRPSVVNKSPANLPFASTMPSAATGTPASFSAANVSSANVSSTNAANVSSANLAATGAKPGNTSPGNVSSTNSQSNTVPSNQSGIVAGSLVSPLNSSYTPGPAGDTANAQEEPLKFGAPINRPRKHKDVLDLDDPEEQAILQASANKRPDSEKNASANNSENLWIPPSSESSNAEASDAADHSSKPEALNRSRLRQMGSEPERKPPKKSRRGAAVLVLAIVIFVVGAICVYKIGKGGPLVRRPASLHCDTTGGLSAGAPIGTAADAPVGTASNAPVVNASQPRENLPPGWASDSSETDPSDSSNTDSGTTNGVTVTPPKMDSALCAEGREFLQRKQFQSALSKFELAIRENPHNGDAFGGRAEAYAGLKRYGEALDDYNKAITLQPDNKRFYKGRGWAYLTLEQFLKAIADYKKAISLDPTDPVLYADLGRCYGGLAQYPQAIDYFNQSLELKETGNTHYLRGGTYYCLKKYSEALADYQRAVALDPKDADSWYGIGSCMYYFKRYKEAREPYRKALVLYKVRGSKAWADKAESFLKEVSAK